MLPEEDFIRVTWRYGDDPEQDYRSGDFLVLHPASRSAVHYDSSKYIYQDTRSMGKMEGDHRFCAPIEAGEYTISMMRDLSIVLHHMHGREIEQGKGLARVKAFQQAYGVKLQLGEEEEKFEHLVCIGASQNFVVLPPDPDIIETWKACRGSLGATRESMHWGGEAARE